MPGSPSSDPTTLQPRNSRKSRATAVDRVYFRAPSITTIVCSVSSREMPGGNPPSLPTNSKRALRSLRRSQSMLAWHTPQSAS